MDALIAQIRTLHAEADEEGRSAIQNSLRDLQSSLDSDWDLILRITSGCIQLPFLKIGNDLSLFATLSSSEDPVSLSDLVAKTSAAPRMLSHLLRAMASFALIDQRSPDTFAANRTTRTMAGDHVAGTIEHLWDLHMPVTNAFPTWLKENKYRDITDNKNLPFHMGVKTDLSPFEWLKLEPARMEALGHAMAVQREESWLDSYPVLATIGDYKATAESALLVDVGGGFGQQALAFKNKVGDLKGNIIVQDVESTLSSAPKIEGVQFQEHDFFQEQPVKDAKFYYLRHILHDWTDQDSIRILKALVPALGPESRIVIDEIVLPDEQLPWQAAYMDLFMMGALGGVERTKAEFETLLDAAGLRILEVQRYDAKMQSVIIVTKK